MIPAPKQRRAGRVRMLLAVGLVINLIGFVYDEAWHATHLSLVPIPPSKLLSIHSGIYVGGLIVLAVSVVAFARRMFDTGLEWVGMFVVAAGLVMEFTGNGTDMWAHGHGYERDFYHHLIYAGAALTVCGYLLLHATHLFGATGRSDGEPSGSDQSPDPVEAAQTSRTRSP